MVVPPVLHAPSPDMINIDHILPPTVSNPTTSHHLNPIPLPTPSLLPPTNPLAHITHRVHPIPLPPNPTPPLPLSTPTPPLANPTIPIISSTIPSDSTISHTSNPSPSLPSPANIGTTSTVPLTPPLPSHSMLTRAKDGIRKPNPRYALLAVTNTLVEPSSFTQANKCPRWRQATAEEFTVLQCTDTWTLVPLQPHLNVLPNKWVYKIKRKSDGSIERFKARLVANGFHQQEGLDYAETFSPVVTHATIRLILSVALHYNWSIRQLDVQNAFLHGSLSEDVYMRQPQGFVDPQFPTHVCKLQRSLYGLKQAPRAWFQCFSNHLEALGFVASQADSSLFTYFDGTTIIYLLIYVDDILVTGNSSSQIAQLIAQLGSLFSMKDLGPLHYFLGMEVTRTTSGFHLSQAKYIRDLLQRTHMADCKPIQTPSSSGRRLLLHEGDPLSDAIEYCSVVGALQYLLFTRPDIAFSANQVCQFMHSPTTVHWAAVKRILRYLKGTHDHGLLYRPSSLSITAYADADYAGDPNDRRSTGGYCIFLGSNLISWSSKKQRGVSRSSTEAEYRQLAYTAATLSWFRNLFHDLHLYLTPPQLWCDNIIALAIASNPVYQARMRHVEVDYHYVCEKVTRKEIIVGYVASPDQVADFLTKGLSSTRFQFLISKLPVLGRPLSLRGRDKP
ncbi:hypothetical protein ACFX10_043195 [Malus domestica]